MALRINPAFRHTIKQQMQAAANGCELSDGTKPFEQYLSSSAITTNEVCYWAAKYGVPVRVIAKGGSIKQIVREENVCECCRGKGHK